MENNDNELLLRPREVAEMLKVDPKTVTRWANSGTLKCIRLPSGQRRYFKADVMALLGGSQAA